jgi:hypothetical protein
MPSAYARPFAPARPTRSAPASPGPVVTVTAPMSLSPRPTSYGARWITGRTECACARVAICGTTRPRPGRVPHPSRRRTTRSRARSESANKSAPPSWLHGPDRSSYATRFTRKVPASGVLPGWCPRHRPARRADGGRRQSHGGREVLAAMVFVVTSGWTGNQLSRPTHLLPQTPQMKWPVTQTSSGCGSGCRAGAVFGSHSLAVCT